MLKKIEIISRYKKTNLLLFVFLILYPIIKINIFEYFLNVIIIFLFSIFLTNCTKELLCKFNVNYTLYFYGIFLSVTRILNL
jgi:hypothetical protein